MCPLIEAMLTIEPPCADISAYSAWQANITPSRSTSSTRLHSAASTSADPTSPSTPAQLTAYDTRPSSPACATASRTAPCSRTSTPTWAAATPAERQAASKAV